MQAHQWPARIGFVAATVLLAAAAFLFVDVPAELRGGLLAVAAIAAVALYLALYVLQRRRHW